jgi:hypothetical protein
MNQDRRAVARLDILGKLSGEVSVLAPILVHDTSPGGVLIECGFPLFVGSTHDLRLHLGNESVIVKARVAHCRIADLGHESVRYVAGLEFMNLPPHAGFAIATYIEQLRRQRESSPAGPAGPDSP